LAAAPIRERLAEGDPAAVAQEIARCLGERGQRLRPFVEAAVGRALAALKAAESGARATAEAKEE
jgi:hypothetical protein